MWARRREDVPPAEVDQYSPKLQVWGGISAQGRTRLVFFKGTLTADKYCNDVLRRARPDFSTIFGADNDDWTFVHDGASPHKAASTNTWLTANVANHITSGPSGEWPANSPDLNIIEQIWGIIDGELERKRPRSLEALKKRIKQIWRDLDDEIVEKQVAHMKKRLKSIIASGGDGPRTRGCGLGFCRSVSWSVSTCNKTIVSLFLLIP